MKKSKSFKEALQEVEDIAASLGAGTVSDTVKEGTEQLSDMEGYLAEGTHMFLKYLKNEPLLTVGVIAAVSVGLGYMIGRKK